MLWPLNLSDKKEAHASHPGIRALCVAISRELIYKFRSNNIIFIQFPARGAFPHAIPICEGRSSTRNKLKLPSAVVIKRALFVPISRDHSHHIETPKVIIRQFHTIGEIPRYTPVCYGPSTSQTKKKLTSATQEYAPFA